MSARAAEMPSIDQTLANPSWALSLRDALDADEVWRRAARWVAGAYELRHGAGSLVVEVADGRAVSVSTDPNVHGADFVVEGDDDAWGRLLDGHVDVISGSASGAFALHGDVVLAMHTMRTLHGTVEVMRRLCGLEAPERSPAPAYPPAETRGAYLDVGGIRTYYEEAGSGAALVCMHAACQDTLMYRHVLDGLSDRYRVITLDAPGHGKTRLPPGGPFTSITQHAEFNERFMDALGLDRPSILGCSMAGNMVLELGARRPGAYRAIVSCEGAAHTPTIDDFTLGMLDANGAVLAEVFARSLTGRRTPAERAEEVVWQLCRATPELMTADLSAYTAFDKRDVLSQIAAPVLLIRGEADWLVTQEMVEETAAAIASSEVSVLAGTGHYPMIENPVEFNDAVRGFLDRAPADPPAREPDVNLG